MWGSGFPACSHPFEVCYETLLLPYLSLRTESGAFRGALDSNFRSCGASLMMPWEGDEISLQSKYGLPNNLIVSLAVALYLLRKSLPPSPPPLGIQASHHMRLFRDPSSRLLIYVCPGQAKSTLPSHG
jgi:hypothetical protein